MGIEKTSRHRSANYWRKRFISDNTDVISAAYDEFYSGVNDSHRKIFTPVSIEIYREHLNLIDELIAEEEQVEKKKALRKKKQRYLDQINRPTLSFSDAFAAFQSLDWKEYQKKHPGVTEVPGGVGLRSEQELSSSIVALEDSFWKYSLTAEKANKDTDSCHGNQNKAIAQATQALADTLYNPNEPFNWCADAESAKEAARAIAEPLRAVRSRALKGYRQAVISFQR